MPGELVLQALRHVWRTLEPLNVPAAVETELVAVRTEAFPEGRAC
jgi:hypothetical protein